ncbi:MAG: allophanate hydrolase subunit 1 [Thiobacillaceae bacterium]
MTERGLRVETGAFTLARYRAVLAAGLNEVESAIPADGSLLIVLYPRAAPSDALYALLSEDASLSPIVPGRLHLLPVEYGGAVGQDLARLADVAGLSVEAAIALHCSVEYRVMFIGFQPGFAYLHGTPAVLQLPRLARPRTHVAVGSLAIGGAYTGIYPAIGPGGWNVIGRVRANLFDPQRDTPALLMPDDRVRFVRE